MTDSEVVDRSAGVSLDDTFERTEHAIVGVTYPVERADIQVLAGELKRYVNQRRAVLEREIRAQRPSDHPYELIIRFEASAIGPRVVVVTAHDEMYVGDKSRASLRAFVWLRSEGRLASPREFFPEDASWISIHRRIADLGAQAVEKMDAAEPLEFSLGLDAAGNIEKFIFVRGYQKFDVDASLLAALVAPTYAAWLAKR